MAGDSVLFFGQTMTADWARMLQEAQQRTSYIALGIEYRRIPYGSETFRQPVEAPSQPCKHCSTIFGKLHEPRCDFEQCPKCSWQCMSCDCEFDELDV